MRSCWGCKYHKAYDDFQVKGFRLCLFFRCALVISNSSDRSYSACATERSTESPVHLMLCEDAEQAEVVTCVSILNTSQITLTAVHQQNSGLILWSAGLLQPRVLLKLQMLPWNTLVHSKTFYWANMDSWILGMYMVRTIKTWSRGDRNLNSMLWDHRGIGGKY